ncbi:MAG: dihydropteroate synthase [Caulobacteraceae bacterium]
MGVVNVTPDSFSDGGRYADHAAAVPHARALIAAGADIVDIGGESTRPHAEPVSEAEEMDRVLPVIAALAADGARISVDTFKSAVAAAAVKAGASIWNDITALRGLPPSDAGNLAVAADLGCEVVLMHMQGEPRTMQDNPVYVDVVGEVAGFLSARAEAAVAAGVAREKIWLDPGVGFGKTVAHNLTLLAVLDRIVALGFPVVLGVSRKRFISAIGGGEDRLGGSLAAGLAGAAAGCAALRVHDVPQTVQALKVWAAIEAARGQ